MDGRAGIELSDFGALFSGAGAEDIESQMLSPYSSMQKGTDSVELELRLIDDFPNHPFKVIDDAKMDELVEDIKKFGVVHPVVVRESRDGRYEMISGHRRTYASRKAGKKTIPARVMNLSDEDAVILMTNTNFLQRTEIKPSEKAKAYRMKYDAIKRQGRAGGSSLDEIGEAAKESGKTVQRFIRLSYLSEDLLGLVDKNKLGISQGVEISYLDEIHQILVYEVIVGMKTTISRDQAILIKKAYQDGKLSLEKMNQIICRSNAERVVSLKAETINEFFGEEVSSEEAESIIISLLTKWKGENGCG